jgi:hypothetical protein
VSSTQEKIGLPCFSVDKNTVPEGKAQEPKVYFEVPFLFGEGKESGGQKDTWIVASGSAALEVEQRTLQDGKRVRAKITPVHVPPHGFYSPLPASERGCRRVS